MMTDDLTNSQGEYESDSRSSLKTDDLLTFEGEVTGVEPTDDKHSIVTVIEFDEPIVKEMETIRTALMGNTVQWDLFIDDGYEESLRCRACGHRVSMDEHGRQVADDLIMTHIDNEHVVGNGYAGSELQEYLVDGPLFGSGT